MDFAQLSIIFIGVSFVSVLIYCGYALTHIDNTKKTH
jgi:hypothetical protein